MALGHQHGGQLVFWHIYKIPIFRQIRFSARHEEHQGLLIRQPR
jgi:hypothetical protein